MDPVCLLHVSVADKVKNSALIVEGEVVGKQSYQEREGKADIYTVQEIKVYKYFKGNNVPQTIHIVTRGGQVGLFAMKTSAENNFAVGDLGVFFLVPASFGLQHRGSNSADYYEVFAAEQGFLRYNLSDSTATDGHNFITDAPGGVYRWMNNYTGTKPVTLQPGPFQSYSNPKLPGLLTVPTITSFSPTTVVAGTRTLLTITGSGFGATRGTGFVEFRNANDPGATSYIQPKANDYRAWSNTQIQVWVPASSNGNGPPAGTGLIRVTNSTASPNQATSTGTLTVTYAVTNIEFNATGQPSELQNNNGTGGYTFRYHSPEFSGNAPATASFVRSMNTWICATNVNWIIGATTTIDVVADDDVNVVRFDNGAELPVGVLGRATSYFTGCINVAAPSDTVWECNEVDVAFDDGTTWEYGPALPSVSEVDFETVSLHELGHAHQILHVINSPAVMHATVSNGVAKRSLLVASDEAAGDFQMTKAVATHGACKPAGEVMTTLDIGGSVSISASPGSTICSGTSVTFTATATVPVGTFTYQWKKNGANVGINSSTYTDAGLANGNQIQCVITVTGGCNLLVNSNTITMTVNPSLAPSVAISANPGNTICAGSSVTFTAVPTNGGASPSYQWKVNGVNAGTNSTTFTTTTLTNGQAVTCVMTSNAACVSPATATSNSITMVVNPAVTPSVTISANPGNTICAGASVTFTAVPTNGGASPSYQWKVNGVNAGTNSTTFTTTLTNGQAVTCVMTSNAACASPTTATSNSITMVVNPAVTPSVTISANPGNTICAGASVTFTAVPTNGGASPSYQWKVNGVNAGTNSTTFTTATLTNGQAVTCVMTSNAACASPTTATSNSITMVVNPAVTPSVTISANPGNTICAGASVTFTAVPTNGGASPSYQWKVNGVNTGTNSTTFTTTTLTNGQAVTCVMTSNAACASPTTATSNSITMVVNPAVTPSVTISANPGNTICAGASVTFTAVPTNGGASPSYQWKVNGVNAGTNSTTFTTTTLTNGQTVTCVMTSNAACVSPTTATSNSITMVVNPAVTPSVAISANPGNTICAGASVTFTAVPTNGGASPSYQWKVNGVNAGTNSTTFTTATLTNGQAVTCVMTSNAACVSPITATSNSITMTVNPTVTPTISISANPGSTICAGASVTFTAVPTNGGPVPTYQWKVNGTNVGTNSTTFTSTTLTNGQIVTCVLTSNATCASPSTATSNGITMTVNPILVPDVTISANPGNTICAGTSVTFTSAPVNGGVTPVYQWQVNGGNVGTNSNTFTSTTLSNGQQVRCIMTTNVTCPSKIFDTSNVVIMTVNSLLTPAVTISIFSGSSICAGANATFTATPTNGGASPSYQWKVNGVNSGTNSSTFSTTTLTNGQVVTCVLTSNATCASPLTATSNGITMTVNPVVVPDVTISANPGNTICAGSVVTFTAVPVNGGGTPAYQWQVNGANNGSNSPTFTTSSLTNGQQVRCILTTNIACPSKPKDTSNVITMNVVSGLALVTSVTPSSGPVGTSITIKGARFATATAVQIGFGSTSSITVSGDTMIVMNVPVGSTSGVVRVTNICGANVTGPSFTVTGGSATLSLTLLLEGYHIGGSTMLPVLFNLGLNPSPNACDSITVQLRTAASPGIVAFSASGVLNSSGNISVTYPGAVNGNSYYIVVLHRNAVQTWSANPILFSAGSATYNFTNFSTKAFGSNQRQMAPGVFGFLFR
ncbi:MAG: IPT/TIG domain-containing protein [Bacteroidetes bacterium]|nr:IPT/TIG domain-containing protein [Bacteroidota bacterium]